MFTGGVPCVMCDRLVYDPVRVTCSDICRDLWLGDVLPARADWDGVQ